MRGGEGATYYYDANTNACGKDCEGAINVTKMSRICKLATNTLKIGVMIALLMGVGTVV